MWRATGAVVSWAALTALLALGACRALDPPAGPTPTPVRAPALALVPPGVPYTAGEWRYTVRGARRLGPIPGLLGGATDRIDVAGRQTAAIVFREAPATLVRWGYQQVGQAGMSSPAAGSPPPLPPVTGTDELVLQGGRIARYTRTPDPASVAVWHRALNAAALARIRRERAAARPAPPDPQARGTPRLGPWVAALGLSLAGVVLLALLKRPTEAP